MALPPNICLVNAARSLCDDVFFAIASTARLDDGTLRALAKRRAPVLQAAARGAPGEHLGAWDTWLVRMTVAMAPIQPLRWLAMADVIDEGISLEGGARGVRSLFTSKPSEKDVARVKAFGGFAARALAAVLGATGTFQMEAKSQRGCFIASLGLPEEDERALVKEEPVRAEALDVPEGLPPKVARAVLRGAFYAAMLEGVDPREEQAVLVIGKKTALPAEEITAAHGEARQRIEAARAFGAPCVDAIRYVLDGEEASDELAVAAAKLTLPMNHRTEAITAVNVGGKVVLAKKHSLDKKQREAALALSWAAALRSDPSYVRRSELAFRHDAVAADLGDEGAGKDARRGVETFLEDELRALVPLVPPPLP
ncbi:hypothetical protein [Polyangium fumosum]|uniref:Uncharacterized protein n=1 Tax=Polyangium fumosum TaxID=889272 RepID=A0A4U1JFZ4_9BACT|nr:hypothetical protein [Polyangium fumosum]TKD10185.1 hypothetical protein E8A74_09220 [Polyangium fumosum]